MDTDSERRESDRKDKAHQSFAWYGGVRGTSRQRRGVRQSLLPLLYLHCGVIRTSHADVHHRLEKRQKRQAHSKTKNKTGGALLPRLFVIKPLRQLTDSSNLTRNSPDQVPADLSDRKA